MALFIQLFHHITPGNVQDANLLHKNKIQQIENSLANIYLVFIIPPEIYKSNYVMQYNNCVITILPTHKPLQRSV